MNWSILVICVLLGLLTALGIIPLIIARAGTFMSGSAVPTFHHTHKTPVSRLGGIVFAVTFVLIAGIAFVFPVEEERLRTQIVVVVSSLAVFLLGFWDDLRPLGARKKLIVQILIAAGVCYFGVQIETFKNPFTGEVYNIGAWALPVTIVWLVSMTNMINLVDGIDGLAGGIALMLMALLAYVGMNGDLTMPFLVASGMCGALLGFLRYNFPPARIYMGDGGAYFLGFLIGILTLVNSQKGTIIAALIAPLFALAFPILDVSVAILRRGLKGLPLFRPDRSHIHHKLIGQGLSRTRALLLLYGLSSVCLLMAFGVFWSQGRWLPILFGLVCLTFLIAGGSFGFSRNWFDLGRTLERTAEMRKESQYALTLARWLELEGDRAKSVEALWVDFTFMAKKMGFTAVTLELEDGRREWKAANDPTVKNRLRCSHELGVESVMQVEISGDGDAMSSDLFDHLSELTAEAWLKAAARWQAVNNLSLRFDA
jgi:UDP-GlcNAc:undecaprenyl-phosphate/decaprenyl-phosphate GlcNAc-1-phosphate transferase